MDSSLQGDDEDLLIPSSVVFQDVQYLAGDDSLYNIFERDPSLLAQLRILCFIPEDHV